MSALGRRNVARLAEEVFERRGDYPALSFEGEWQGSAAPSSARPGSRAVSSSAASARATGSSS